LNFFVSPRKAREDDEQQPSDAAHTPPELGAATMIAPINGGGGGSSSSSSTVIISGELDTKDLFWVQVPPPSPTTPSLFCPCATPHLYCSSAAHVCVEI
jgi:hypothetical protein